LIIKDLCKHRKIVVAIRKRVVYIGSMKVKVSKEVKEYMANIGRVGGKAAGPRKARTSEQARAAVMARWAKAAAKKKENQQ